MPSTQKRMTRFQSSLPKGVSFPFTAVQVSTIFTAIIAAIGYFFLPPQIPLFYSLSQPEQQLTTKEFIFILPGLSVTFAVINSLIILKLQKYDILLIKLFAWVTVVFSTIFLFALIRILFIVT